jgi:hypothetical protein
MRRGAHFLGADPAPLDDVPRAGLRLTIFPGSAVPSVFHAHVPFWTGCGFVPRPGGQGLLDVRTRFELDVDGEPVLLETNVQRENGRPVWKVSIADFAAGLNAGWHRFEGRWYDARALILTSDASIEFVER